MPYLQLQARLSLLVPSYRPSGSRTTVTLARDPLLDAWKGAATMALLGPQALRRRSVTVAEYREMGPGYLREHRASNMFFPTPL